jgi:hypothetical protein
MINNSRDIAKLLLKKMEDVAKGENLTGADTLCRLTETFIKLATIEMQYAHAKSAIPYVPELFNGPVPALPEPDKKK